MENKKKIQEKYADRPTAVKRASELAITEDFVQLIKSGDKYYIENNPNMIRVWEEVILTFEK